MENFKNAIQSLTTLKKVDDYGMFQMTYCGDYGFDEFLKIGITDDNEDGFAFMMKHLLKGIPYNPTSSASKALGGGCTTFVTRNEKGEVLLCRNYDFAPIPALQLFTKPDNGYASVSTANMLYAGYSLIPNPMTGEPHLPGGLNLESFAALYAPYLTMDGMNAKGVGIASVFIPKSEAPFDPNKVKIDQCNAIRLVIDAASVDEAIDLLGQYNIIFEFNIYVQYHIADASGRSVIVNFTDGEIRITEISEPYQVCANFAANNPEIRGGVCEFERHDKAKAKLEANGGILTDAQAIDLMEEIGAFNEGQFDLQWSVMYNLTTLEGVIFANRNKSNLIHFNVEGKK